MSVYIYQAFIWNQDRISSTAIKSRLADGEPGLSASNRKPQLDLSDNTDTDTEQNSQCAL